MNDRPLHSALRELRTDLAQPQTLAVLAGIAIVLALMGPFGTEDVLRFLPRLAYWTAIVALTFAAGHIASGVSGRVLGHRLSRWPLVIAMGLSTGVAVSCVVLVLNFAAFDILPSGAVLIEFLLSIFGISLVIAIVFDIVTRNQPAPAADAKVETIPLLDRIPPQKRGPLVALSVEDHYVRIRTVKGEEMVLMRLGDAMREVGATDGFQVHRSHWVAKGQISGAERQGDRALLTMTHGPEIPVSRANIAKLKEAGLLPR